MLVFSSKDVACVSQAFYQGGFCVGIDSPVGNTELGAPIAVTLALVTSSLFALGVSEQSAVNHSMEWYFSIRL